MYSCLLTISWVTIFACAILKLFGSTAFEMPEFTYNINIWVRRIINLIFYEANSILLIITLVKRKLSIKEILFIIPVMFIPFFCSFFIDYPIILALRYILETLALLVIGKILSKDKLVPIALETLVVTVIFMFYQFITLFYRNLGIGLSVDNFIAEKLLLIDFYILLMLTALISIKKGGYIHGWRWSRFLVVLSKRRRSEESVRQNQVCVQQKEDVGFKLFIVMLSVFQI